MEKGSPCRGTEARTSSSVFLDKKRAVEVGGRRDRSLERRAKTRCPSFTCPVKWP